MTTTQPQEIDRAEEGATRKGERIEALYELHCWNFRTGETPQPLTGAAADILSELNWDAETGTPEDFQEALEQYVQQMSLTVMVRSDWQPVGSTFEAQQFEILLSTGGPACRILGYLDRGSVAWEAGCRPVIQHQDWFKPWTESTYNVDTNALVWFCEQFYYGE